MLTLKTFNDIHKHHEKTELAYKLTKSTLVKSTKKPTSHDLNMIIKLGKSCSDLDTILIQFENVAHLIKNKSVKRRIIIEDLYLDSLLKSWNESNPTEKIELA